MDETPIREWEVENKRKNYIQIIIFVISKEKWILVKTEIEGMD